MCTTGVSAQIMNGSDGQPAYSSIWGNIIGFALASTGPLDAGSDALGVYDAPAHGITGFAFDIDAVLPGGHIRVTFSHEGDGEQRSLLARGHERSLSDHRSWALRDALAGNRRAACTLWVRRHSIRRRSKRSASTS